MFDLIYKKLYILGLYTAKYVTRFFRAVSKFIKKPIKALGMVFYAGFLLVDRFFLNSARLVVSEAKELASDVRRVFSAIKGAFKSDKSYGLKMLRHYVKKAFAKHGVVFSFLTNIVTPAVALAVLCLTVNYWSSQNLALKITYNHSDIGYVKNESVYLEAEKQANERLRTAAVANNSESLVNTAQYSIENVSLSELKDSQAICNGIIEKSDSNITNACGIYIDGDFLCAVKNETDATTVFDNILKAHETGDEAATVSFVEDIQYVQGFYLDDENTVWDADKLNKKLSTKKSEAVYYTVQSGDTVSGIAQKFGLTTAEVYALNPSVQENIHIGDRLLISSEVNFIRVQVTRTEVRTETIRYNTVTNETASLYKGVKKTVQKGVEGEQQITELVSYVDGVRISSKEISRVTTRQPVDEIIQVGTKTYSSSYGTVTSYGGSFIWPAIGAYRVSQYFGGRNGHGGIDIVKPGGNSTGCTIVAAAGGTVISAGYHPSWGYNVVVNHGNGLSTRYAHMLPGSMKVRVGQSVSQGQALGNIGSSGNVTGPHLHFEVMVNGRRVNPMPYLGRSR